MSNETKSGRERKRENFKQWGLLWHRLNLVVNKKIEEFKLFLKRDKWTAGGEIEEEREEEELNGVDKQFSIE